MYDRLGILEKMDLIPITKTKEYFREAYSCYSNGNYRAAVVSLWSVMVCDAVYKTELLVSSYNDAWAIKRLKEIEELQEKKSTSSDWELNLFEQFYKDKGFIDSAGISNIRYLQQKRHLCAHPVLSENSNLYTPSKDTVKSLLTNALDDFLLKEEYYNKDVLNLILETMKERSEYYEKISNVKSLILRFSKKMTERAMYQVFKSLWSISFKVENKDCDDNRRSNSFACVFLFDEIKKKEAVVNKVWDEIESFEDVSHKQQVMSFLFLFFCEQPMFYKRVSNEFKDLIGHYYNKEIDDNDPYPYNLKIASTFLFDNPADYLEYLNNGYKNQTINYLTVDIINFIERIYHDFTCDDYIKKIIVSYVLSSTSYANADERFDFLFKEDVFHRLDIKSLELIVNSWAINSQVSGRTRRAAPDLHRIKNRIEEIQ
ncbi:hypothetical protein P8990_12910 [Serratia marcescens]|uniref:hypothetical protein n=1 Tax=Serratia marcescens TaxID=615 RepID=UPI003204A8EB